MHHIRLTNFIGCAFSYLSNSFMRHPGLQNLSLVVIRPQPWHLCFGLVALAEMFIGMLAIASLTFSANDPSMANATANEAFAFRLSIVWRLFCCRCQSC
jgi:hypothetical protein